jgi:hypothetical protein
MGISRRSFFLVAAAAAPLLLSACGPSAGQLKTAREARYQGTRDEVFFAVSQALAMEKEKVDKLDAEQGAVLTVGHWYEPDGTSEDRALGKDSVQVQDGSIYLAFVVTVVGDAPPYGVMVEPTVDQFRNGYSALYHMTPTDPQLPGWVKGKVDDLQLGLYSHLKSRVVTAPAATAAK